jgi:hypothetical protein
MALKYLDELSIPDKDRVYCFSGDANGTISVYNLMSLFQNRKITRLPEP